MIRPFVFLSILLMGYTAHGQSSKEKKSQDVTLAPTQQLESAAVKDKQEDADIATNPGGGISEKTTPQIAQPQAPAGDVQTPNASTKTQVKAAKPRAKRHKRATK